LSVRERVWECFMRRFVLVGEKARASPDFLLVDIPSTSGRLDALLRALRASLLVSHGVRTDTVVYLVLLGDPARPRTLRVDGAAARYLRPDERSLATTAKKALGVQCEQAGFNAVRNGIAVADGGIEVVLPELAGSTLYLLEQNAPDIRACVQLGAAADNTFVVGDHLGLTEATRETFLTRGACSLSVGPRALHSEDAIAIASNELDRREVVA
jgi:tRNA (pseudouridine54-N1)-methyltransferase